MSIIALSNSSSERPRERISARDVIEARWRYLAKNSGMSAAFVFNDLPTITLGGKATQRCRHQARVLYEQMNVKGYVDKRKLEHFITLVVTAKRAIHQRCGIRYSRAKSKSTRAQLQVIDAAIAAGYFEPFRAPKGAPRMSRLIPTPKLAALADMDPWSYDDTRPSKLVRLRRRGADETEADLDFNPELDLPRNVGDRLADLNELNAKHYFTYCPFDTWDQSPAARRRFRPIHHALYHITDDDPEWMHGRIYGDHQQMRKIERPTILIDREPTVELDFSSYHAMILYHQAGIDYRDDPYALWGHTSAPLRLLGKLVMACHLNATTRQAAMRAATSAACQYDRKGKPKRGKDREEADLYQRALDETGLNISDIFERAEHRHTAIAKHFGTDAGHRLMTLDAEICLDVLVDFTRRKIPILGIHDSFVVAEQHQAALHATMIKAYQTRVKTDFIAGIKATSFCGSF